MSDAKLFTRGKAAELRAELSLDKKDRNHKSKKTALKKIVANMTMSNNEMIQLFPDIIACMSIHDIDVRKMCFLYLLTYAKAKPRLALEALPVLIEDMTDSSPLLRALALRTASSIPVKEFFETALEYTIELLHDDDAYVRKTAAYSAAKLYHQDPTIVEKNGIIDQLNGLITDTNPMAVAAALASLMDITESSQDLQLKIDTSNAFTLAHILKECNEWCQIYILQALMYHVPTDQQNSAMLIEQILPRLQHENASVVLGSVRVLVYLSNFVPEEKLEEIGLERRIGQALVILLSKPPELQYLTLRNCILLLQSQAHQLNLDVRVFFCKYNDPIYVKATKLEIVFLLANEKNIGVVLEEFQECATEIDVQIVRKSVRAIGKLAVKIESAASACINAILELVQTRVSYIVQEATIVMKDIFRRYPNRYEKTIGILCDNMDSLDEPEAKAAMIWIIGQYADRIDDSHILLDEFLNGFLDEPDEVQLTLLTAIVKLFILRPSKGQALVPKVLKMATEEVDNPDLRDRGFMYWRLLSANPNLTNKISAKEIVMDSLPIISTDSDRMDDTLLEELELVIGSLATIYLKPIKQVFRSAKVKTLPQSTALFPRRRSLFNKASTNGGDNKQNSHLSRKTSFKPLDISSNRADLMRVGSGGLVSPASNNSFDVGQGKDPRASLFMHPSESTSVASPISSIYANGFQTTYKSTTSVNNNQANDGLLIQIDEEENTSMEQNKLL